MFLTNIFILVLLQRKTKPVEAHTLGPEARPGWKSTYQQNQTTKVRITLQQLQLNKESDRIRFS